MKKLIFSLATLLLLTVTYQSCDLMEGLGEHEEGVCGFVYPLTLVMPNDGLVTVNDEDELGKVYENLFDNNPNSNDEPTFQYPLQMTNIDGEVVTVNNDAELESAFEECNDYDYGDCGEGKWDSDDKDNSEWYDKKDCFDLVYPVSMTMPDGIIITGTNEDSLETAIKNWYIANPNSNQEPTFNYPIQITYDDGTVDILRNDNELWDAYDKCDDWENCFDYIYPITIVFPDNTTATANDEDAMETAIKNWYDANPNSTSEFTFSYPVQIKYEDGTTKTINDDIELEAAYDDCK
ncbi:MAG: hypothetical protein ACPGXZ_01090 [Saprospiraceae bacterium]